MEPVWQMLDGSRSSNGRLHNTLYTRQIPKRMIQRVSHWGDHIHDARGQNVGLPPRWLAARTKLAPLPSYYDPAELRFVGWGQPGQHRSSLRPAESVVLMIRRILQVHVALRAG